MTGQHQVTARWKLAEPLDLEWRGWALCRSRPDLPWTPDVAPVAGVFGQMRALCAQCPVVSECADFGLSQPGGFYAGVFTPWHDGGPRLSESARESRSAARRQLRWVRDSATHLELVENTPRSHRDERPVSLSAGRTYP